MEQLKTVCIEHIVEKAAKRPVIVIGGNALVSKLRQLLDISKTKVFDVKTGAAVD
jgi:hypothetical protein